MKNNEDKQKNKNKEAIHEGMKLVDSHSIFGRMDSYHYVYSDRKTMGRDAAAVAGADHIYLNTDKRMRPDEWALVLHFINSCM